MYTYTYTYMYIVHVIYKFVFLGNSKFTILLYNYMYMCMCMSQVYEMFDLDPVSWAALVAQLVRASCLECIQSVVGSNPT